MECCLVQKKVLYPFCKQVGGTILAAKLAKERGCAINVRGGFHHCCADRGGGFCAYADISLCSHYAFIRLNITWVMIIDLDAHQGNGYEKDFSNDGRVYILDMYNPNIYPLVQRMLLLVDSAGPVNAFVGGLLSSLASNPRLFKDKKLRDALKFANVSVPSP